MGVGGGNSFIFVYMKESVDIVNNEYKKKKFFDLYIIIYVYKLYEEMCCINCMYTRWNCVCFRII